MPAFLGFVIRRVGFILLTLVTISILLFAVMSAFPPETRALLYFPKHPGRMSEASQKRVIQAIIKSNGFNDPFYAQYVRWASNLLRGDWGWSPTANDEVLPALLRLTPATAELTLYSLLLFIPAGIISGVVAGSRKGRPADSSFRLGAFVATSTPPFILAILLMAMFYVSLHWFPPGRISDHTRLVDMAGNYRVYTGFITIDGLLNGRPAITVEAFRYLVLPVITLSAYHWATLGRVTRSVMIEELRKDYITAARARGISERSVTWRHAFRNTLLPALNSSLVSAASLLTSVFIVEAIFNFPGISQFLNNALKITYLGQELVPDVNAALGISLYSILVVLLLMSILDLMQSGVDPRYRQGISRP